MSKSATVRRTFARLRKHGPYPCPACARVFALPMGLARHQGATHGGQAAHVPTTVAPGHLEAPRPFNVAAHDALQHVLAENLELREQLQSIRRALGNGQP